MRLESASRGKMIGSFKMVRDGLVWWKDLGNLEGGGSPREGWFSGGLSRSVCRVWE